MADKAKPNGLTLTAFLGDFYSLTSCFVFYMKPKNKSTPKQVVKCSDSGDKNTP